MSSPLFSIMSILIRTIDRTLSRITLVYKKYNYKMKRLGFVSSLTGMRANHMTRIRHSIYITQLNREYSKLRNRLRLNTLVKKSAPLCVLILARSFAVLVKRGARVLFRCTSHRSLSPIIFVICACHLFCAKSHLTL